MIIGIMGAMLEEVKILLCHMENVVEKNHGNRVYYSGTLKKNKIVLVFSGCGKVAASATATSLITEFGIGQLIFFGVAGAVSADLEVGDIVISEKLYQHDMDARPIFKRYEIPFTGITFFNADKALVQKSEKAVRELISSLAQRIPSDILNKFNLSRPKLMTGTIASGDQFITDPKATEEILTNQPETLAVEMEGAAVAQVCHDYAVPFVIIRTISDRADHQAPIDFKAFVEEIACHYSENIIALIFDIDRLT